MSTEVRGASLIEQALAAMELELDGLREQRAEIEARYTAEARPLDQRINALDAAVTHQRHALQALAGASATLLVQVSVNGKGAPKLTEVAYAILRDAGKPLHYKALTDRLMERGVPIMAKNPGLFVIAYLRREPERFCRGAVTGEYALVEWALPDARPIANEPKKKRATKRRPVRGRTVGRSKK